LILDALASEPEAPVWEIQAKGRTCFLTRGTPDFSDYSGLFQPKTDPEKPLQYTRKGPDYVCDNRHDPNPSFFSGGRFTHVHATCDLIELLGFPGES